MAYSISARTGSSINIGFRYDVLVNISQSIATANPRQCLCNINGKYATLRFLAASFLLV